MIAGVDEVARGPVIGPMVMAIVATDDEMALTKMGVKDSKDVPPEKREQLFSQLQELPHEIISLSPAEIDESVNSDNDNLNKLEARTTALLIHRMLEREPIEKVIVDSPTKDGGKHEVDIRKELVKLTKKHVEILCEIKADANYPVVGAASILAKVTRDAVLQRIRETHNVGSGYPADPKTQAFLGKHWQEGHDFFRKSWKSYKRLTEGAGQASLGDFGPKAKEHKEVIEKFEVLKEHGFVFQEPTNQYEVLRMRRDKTTIVRYTTGKILIQGPDKEEIEQLLKKHSLV